MTLFRFRLVRSMECRQHCIFSLKHLVASATNYITPVENRPESAPDTIAIQTHAAPCCAKKRPAVGYSRLLNIPICTQTIHKSPKRFQPLETFRTLFGCLGADRDDQGQAIADCWMFFSTAGFACVCIVIVSGAGWRLLFIGLMLFVAEATECVNEVIQCCRHCVFRNDRS